MNSRIQELLGLIQKNSSHLEKIIKLLDKVYVDDIPKIGKTQSSALMIAGILDNYYTCLETVLFRISQVFENNLDQSKWHKALLDKMNLSIEGIRPAVVSDANYNRLLELLKFRHFRRYYFEMEYDWDRIEFLEKKLYEAHPHVLEDLRIFSDFLRRI
ncbi:MAG: hypothetical protein K9L75_03480 [Spirochaetia bacterium]|nr:hypothetical protein [Spirochaetia bacterium]